MNNTLDAFATAAGVMLVECDAEEWDGPVGYTHRDNPRMITRGFATPAEAYEHWVSSTFGESAGGALLELLRGQPRQLPVARVQQGLGGSMYVLLLPQGTLTPVVKEGDLLYL